MSNTKRLNKFISETGFCSRREADKLIENGQVRINGFIAEVGTQVCEDDKIEINGKPLKNKPKAVFIVYNKPVGITCTTEKKIQSNIIRAINYPERIFPIGRLDRPSEGLIFLTNEGDIVNKILRAGNNHEKEYIVRVDKPLNGQFINKMANGVPILGTVTQKCKVSKISSNSFNIVLTQGLNRQIRRMCEYLGYEVLTLQRIRIMNVDLKGLKPGQWRHLTAQEMNEINKSVANSGKTQEHSVDLNKTSKNKKFDKVNRHENKKHKTASKSKAFSGNKTKIKGKISLKNALK